MRKERTGRGRPARGVQCAVHSLSLTATQELCFHDDAARALPYSTLSSKFRFQRRHGLAMMGRHGACGHITDAEQPQPQRRVNRKTENLTETTAAVSCESWL
jgi:hypothetical protein